MRYEWNAMIVFDRLWYIDNRFDWCHFVIQDVGHTGQIPQALQHRISRIWYLHNLSKTIKTFDSYLTTNFSLWHPNYNLKVASVKTAEKTRTGYNLNSATSQCGNLVTDFNQILISRVKKSDGFSSYQVRIKIWARTQFKLNKIKLLWSSADKNLTLTEVLYVYQKLTFKTLSCPL